MKASAVVKCIVSISSSVANVNLRMTAIRTSKHVSARVIIENVILTCALIAVGIRILLFNQDIVKVKDQNG